MVQVPTIDSGDGRKRADFGCAVAPVAKTAAYTVVLADTGKTFTNKGAAGSVTFTLPAATAGVYFVFMKAVNDQNIVITAPTAGTMNYLTQGVTLTDSTSEYGTVTIESDGTSWFVTAATGTWSVT